jgi:hypothetical protein
VHELAPELEEQSIFEVFLPFLRTRRLEREAEILEDYEREKKLAKAIFKKRLKEYREKEAEAMEVYDTNVREFNGKLQAAKCAYERERAEFEINQKTHNVAVQTLRSQYQGRPAGHGCPCKADHGCQTRR